LGSEITLVGIKKNLVYLITRKENTL